MGTPHYRYRDAALLRAAVAPLAALPDTWPDLEDTDSCRDWLAEQCDTDLAEAIAHAVPDLATNLAALRAGTDTLSPRRIRSTTKSVLRYLLRATGRPTPNGILAGVAPAGFGDAAALRWGHGHRTRARVDTAWLDEIITHLENTPTLLPHLRVVVSNLTVRLGGRLYLPHGPNRVSLPLTPALALIHSTAATPITVDVLLARLMNEFPAGTPDSGLAMITTLLDQGVLISHLRAPSTVTDLLDHLIAALVDIPEIESLPEVAALLAELVRLDHELVHHNLVGPSPQVRDDLVTRMRHLATAGRSPLALDATLDCTVTLPCRLGDDLDLAATALLRLSRHPGGEPIWRDYHRRFLDRYGVGTLVPVTEVLNPGAGLGYPAGYPGSILPEPMQPASLRDSRLLALACRALVTGTDEVVLTDGDLDDIAGDTTFTAPPHVELAVRINAASTAALDRGVYSLTVLPVRSVGTLTGRFAHAAPALAGLYAELPAGTRGATRAQLTFAPVYPVSENISRVPVYLDHLIALGEHHPPHRADVAGHIGLTDLCVTATADRLHLVDRSGRVIEPQVFHALALDKQPAPLIRFLAQLPRGFDTAWTRLDWGVAADMPMLPRVRYGRSTLSPASWRITDADLPAGLGGDAACITLNVWRLHWRCPAVVELRDDDRPLRLDLAVPAHVALLRDHLRRHGHAILAETTTITGLGWIGHAHDVIVPLVATRDAGPAPATAGAPLLVNELHGALPAAPDTRWLSVHIYTHPERMDEVISEHLPALLAGLDQPQWWFIRYRSPDETDHLRLRLHTPHAKGAGSTVDALTRWAVDLRHHGVTGRATLDTYYPEVGRYGGDHALDAAETVFKADSSAVQAGINHLAVTMAPEALVAAGMVHIVRALLGDDDAAWTWLADHKPVMQAASPAPLDRDTVDHARRVALTATGTYPTEWPAEVAGAWLARADALRAYAGVLPVPVPDSIVESLLHMHHNRAVGPDRDSEHLARRIARQAALTARAQAVPR
ncbi:MAG: Lanthionine biosynthesis protein LanB [Amycolatopsis sp.]|uniref:lantibiotic dehydratase n=1 Tax=Amycolatopsis sp. TaxID=37632 RepID=UPI002619BB2B|nr:lantibiotic dehydratase [Amycolatopsis sp.]MCU1685197.1 Lanthionine biosynthesis protein LanB [Amycolatopsis sp.]